MFFLVYDKNISFLSAEGSFWIGNFVCGEVKNVGILTYSEAFDEMAGKIYRQKPVDLCGAPPAIKREVLKKFYGFVAGGG